MNIQILTITIIYIISQFLFTALTTKDYKRQVAESISLAGLGLILAYQVQS